MIDSLTTGQAFVSEVLNAESIDELDRIADKLDKLLKDINDG